MTIENGPEKIQGYIMKMTITGMMIELDKINFKIGTFLQVNFELGNQVYIEKVRSIKHYDGYVRPLAKKKNPKGTDAEPPPPVPKKLCEVHFVALLEPTRVAITKQLLTDKQESHRR